jgi:hypothetical protein
MQLMSRLKSHEMVISGMQMEQIGIQAQARGFTGMTALAHFGYMLGDE